LRIETPGGLNEIISNGGCGDAAKVG